MKKIVFSIVFFTVCWTASQAQSFNLGLKAGINLAKLSTDLADKENRLGYQVGAWARFSFAGIYLQPEAYIGSKGSKFVSFTSNSNTEVTAEGKAKFTTLDIPVLLGTKVGAKNFNVRFMAGPVVSFVLDNSSTFSSAYDQATDFKNYKNQAIGIQGGVGVDISSLTVDLRYEAGLSNISKSDKYSQKSNLWQLSLGYKIF